jgi:tetratricopeptide (TPR) repeat protein
VGQAMIENKESSRSLVIPKWLPYSKVCNDEDYSIPRKKGFIIDSRTKNNLERDYLEFKDNPNILSASDLLSSAIAINDIKIAKDAARYLKSHKNINKVTIHLADKILGNNYPDNFERDFNSDIGKIKQFLSKYPKNPIYWIELARLYTIKGYAKKAARSVIAALNLAPYDRYIVRAGFRFFVHIDEFDRAFYHVNKAANLTSDPWLRATEINAAILNNMKLGKVRKFNPKVVPFGKVFHYSELFESLGILEFSAGNNQKAKKNFKFAWSDPSENVVAHGEWILRNIFPSLLTTSNLDFSKSAEASTWQYYYELKLDDALDCVRDWCLQEPYSTHPFACGSVIACHDKRPNEGIRFAKEGLIANPHDITLKNNLAFAYLRSNNSSGAELILNTFPKILSEREKIFFLATSGLLNYRKRNIALGRSLYLESINLCKKIRDKRLTASASLHLAIAELESNTEMGIKYGEEALKTAKDLDYPEIILPSLYIKDMLKKHINKTV